MRNRGIWWVLFVVFLLVGLFFALAFAVGLDTALTGNVRGEGTRGDAIAGAVFLGILAVLAFLAARLFEHRARTGQLAKVSPAQSPTHRPAQWTPLDSPVGGPDPAPVDAPSAIAGNQPFASAGNQPFASAGNQPFASAGPGTMSQPGTQAVWLKPGQKHPSSTPYRHHPHSSIVGLIVVAVLVIVFLVGTLVTFDEYQQSQETQHHGVSTSATVTKVVSIYHSSRYSSYYTYNLDVDLSTPVGGHTTSQVNTPYRNAPNQVGDQISVLVDPKSPSYAELPGVPDSTATGFITFAIFTVVLLSLIGWSYLRRRWRMRANR